MTARSRKWGPRNCGRNWVRRLQRKRKQISRRRWLAATRAPTLPVIPEPAEGQNPESGNKRSVRIWTPGPALKRRPGMTKRKNVTAATAAAGRGRNIHAHDPEKWEPVLG